MGGERVANFYFAKNIQNKTNLLSSTLTDVSIILKREGKVLKERMVTYEF